MGQKVNPVGMRIGITKDWNSRWFASNKEYPDLLNEDIRIRDYITKKLPRECYLSHIEIERKKTNNGHYIRVYVFVGRPGLVIGEKGALIKALESDLQKKVLDNKKDVIKLNAVEIKPQNQNLDAKIVATKIALQLEARASFRIAQKRAIQDVRKAGAKGCKTAVSGRLGGAEIARSEGYKDGTMAINTLRSDIDFAVEEARTTYGKLGVKVWICRGENELSPTKEESKDTTKKGE